ncbi:hypothetical protein IJ768_00590 [Candidatus Saccharibacteria bacterium]|nr:hypothetical protein [Candidatus Saccharibacteria bacterium]
MSKNRNIKKGFVALPVLGLAAISSALIFGATPSTNAASSTATSQVTVTVGSVIGIGATDISFTLSSPSTTGTFASGTGTVAVKTNDVSGYSVYLTSNSTTSTSLDHESVSTSKINSISSTQTISGSTTTFSTADTWGWSKDGSTFYPVVTKGTKSTAAIPTLYRKTSVPALTNDESTLTIGVTGTSSLVSGDYTGTLLLTAITNSDTTTLQQYDSTI